MSLFFVFGVFLVRKWLGIRDVILGKDDFLDLLGELLGFMEGEGVLYFSIVR